MKSGRGRQRVGVALLLLGGLLLLLTVRNPEFEPSSGLRAPIEAGKATVEVPSPGRYVAYFEPDEGCTNLSTSTAVVSMGELTAVRVEPVSERFRRYEFEGRCASAIAVYGIPAAGEVTVSTPSAVAGVANLHPAAVALYPADDLPTAPDWSMAWVFGPLLAVGLALVVSGSLQARRWRTATGLTR
jgi:hypothetical protein